MNLPTIVVDLDGINLSVKSDNPQRVRELVTLLRRGLNTWIEPPKWLLELDRDAEQLLSHLENR